MKRLVAHALAIAIGACAGIAAAQLNGGVMESQRAGTVAITSGAINGTTIGATTPSTGAFTTLSATSLAVSTTKFTASAAGAVVGRGQATFGQDLGQSNSVVVYGNGTTALELIDNAGTPNRWQLITGADAGNDGKFAIYDVRQGQLRLKIDTAGAMTVQGVTTFTAGVKGSATNDAATAGNVGELLTTTVASGSAVSLTTATSANIATLSLTAGDWDCSAQVTHNAAATTSVTLLQIGISATTATLPTQAGGSGIGTDPLAIWRQAAAVPGGALTTNVGPVRVTLSGTTNVFLVANDTFTVSTMTAYGTIRCRRMR